MKGPHIPHRILFLSLALVLGACGGHDDNSTPPAATAAAPLTCDQVGALKINGVTLSTKMVTATSTNPENCAVSGAIAPSQGGYNINFTLTLPTTWNGKAIQGGGGGFDGVISPVTGPNWATPAAAAAFPQKGYATYSSDSGHTGGSDASFALNNEAFLDYGSAALKKVKDVATQIITDRYAKAPSKTYFIGFSEGGREGLEVAQSYPNDYDGIIVGDPVQNLTLQFISHLSVTKGFFANNGAGWLNVNKQNVLGQFVLNACDELDGLKDGLIANGFACKPDITPLRCPNGVDSGDTCLSDAQIAAVNNARANVALPYALANGITTIAGKPWGNELFSSGGYFRSDYLGTVPVPSAPEPNLKTDAILYYLANEAVRYMFLQNAQADPRVWDWNDTSNAARLQYVSSVIDSTKSDLSTFMQRGGKLIIYAGGASEVAPAETAAFYQRLVAKMGQATVDKFARFYVFPGVTHGGVTANGTPRGADLMSAFENWEDNGVAPGDLVNSSGTAGTTTETWPLCRYPAYPRYNGSGDPTAASSFTCSTI
ncbi:tannase/feruloyl esterase family alpha/beta hydrolase [Burkholderia cenocepacia]|uniref:tannase/feruloyl esterase family alpha/beta hydrolase n=1 Tax=Burkholderia cenocepacia TaxID=95486 RepID=UPI00285C6822|nr:tannase/feruloyl esterase family alpha/beta hydrolase [Burkholderia cenocepacia]MDR8071401.1 tannase/feruloyl esterase family alpha/beta hydrolase [Burkholderia cenocepacia]